MSKELLLSQADTLLVQARRLRKFSASQPEPDRDRLARDAAEMEGKAARLEQEAASAKTHVVARVAGDWLAKLANASGRPR
jgi:hypothetical protein